MASFQDDLKKSFENHCLTCEKIDFLVESKIDQQDFDKLLARFEKFSDIEHMDQLKNTLMPKISRFSNLMDEFIKDNEMMRECVRKFDEDMTLKANKGELVTM